MKIRNFFLALFILLIPAQVMAMEFFGGKSVVIDTLQNDDTYIRSDEVRVHEDVNGDLAAGGGTLTVESRVNGDLFLAGGNINVAGEVFDDARLAGGNIRITANIHDDLMVACGSLEIDKSALLQSDLLFGCGNASLGGVISGNVRGSGGNIYFNSRVRGNVNLNADQITFGPNAYIEGDLTYKASKEMEIKSNIVKGKVTFHPMKAPVSERQMAWIGTGILAGISIISLLTTLFFGLFFIWIYKYFAHHAVQHVMESPLQSLGLGLLTLICTPILAILFMVTVIGIPIGIIMFIAWIILIYIAKVMASMVIGWRILHIDEKASFGKRYLAFLLGAVIYTAMGIIPVVGWAINCLLILFSFGGIVLYYSSLLPTLRKKKLI